MTVTPLRLDAVVKTFEDVLAVDGVDLELAPGELLALVGPSGCGKSTLLRSIAGLVAIDSGTIRLAGALVDDGRDHLPPNAGPPGWCSKSTRLPAPHRRRQHRLRLRDHRTDERQTRIDELLELVDLAGFGDRFPHELSGGERQRVALARALAPSPALMLFDEPFASLDHNLRIKLRHDVAAALKATGTPAVFVTHDQQEALAIGDRIAVMRNGRIRQLGTPAEVYHQPVDDFVAAFMGTASFLPSRMTPRPCWGRSTSTVPLQPMPSPWCGPTTSCSPPRRRVGRNCRRGLPRQWLAPARRVHDGVDVYFTVGHLDAPAVGDRGTLALTPGHCQVVVPRR